ncbi:MAG: sugar phosphate isomerase/epimerase [Candidatus Aminicenantes bacterium]|nr:sugar phosphate isomerase/epimerase [Candidatus Aminicenantes bacterium]
MNRTSRRNFLKAAGAGLAAPAISKRLFSGQEPILLIDRNKFRFELGICSYTFRAFNLEETMAMTKRLGLRKISLKSMHLPLESSPDQIKAVAAKIRQSGLDPYAGGVIYMKTEAEARQAFEYAKAAGMKMIVGVPNHELLDLAYGLVKQHDIMLAVHNHGPTDKLYPTPESVYDKIKGMDKRVGMCLDVGHTQRSGIDPAAAAERYSERLLDLHIKDVTDSTAEGTTVEIGRGVVDIPKLLRTLVKLGYAGAVSLEYEKDEKDPLPGAAESIGYVRGALASL